MSENLGNFLVDLACDPQLMTQFVGDPARVLAQTTLSDRERTIVLTRDPRLLADALGSTGYSLGQGVNDVPPTPPAIKPPAKKKKTPPKKKKTPRTPAKKAPARPSRKKR